MDFCAAILTLKVEENMQHFQCFMLFISKKVKMQLECIKKIGAVYGEGPVTDQTCPKWFAKFLGTIDILAK